MSGVTKVEVLTRSPPEVVFRSGENSRGDEPLIDVAFKDVLSSTKCLIESAVAKSVKVLKTATVAPGDERIILLFL